MAVLACGTGRKGVERGGFRGRVPQLGMGWRINLRLLIADYWGIHLLCPAAQAAASERSRLELEINKLQLQLDAARLDALEEQRSPGKAGRGGSSKQRSGKVGGNAPSATT